MAMRRIRTDLFYLALAVLAPLVAFAVVTAVLLVRVERSAIERGAQAQAALLLPSVDSQQRGLITALQTLAASPALDSNDLRAFHQHASEAMRSRPDWQTISLALPSGQQVVNTQRPFGAQLPLIAVPEVAERVARTQQPEISDVAMGRS